MASDGATDDDGTLDVDARRLTLLVPAMAGDAMTLSLARNAMRGESGGVALGGADAGVVIIDAAVAVVVVLVAVAAGIAELETRSGEFGADASGVALETVVVVTTVVVTTDVIVVVDVVVVVVAAAAAAGATAVDGALFLRSSSLRNAHGLQNQILMSPSNVIVQPASACWRHSVQTFGSRFGAGEVIKYFKCSR